MDIKMRSGLAAVSLSRIGIDDFYWLTVPLWEIQKKAREQGVFCSYFVKNELQKCSEDSVKPILCGCVSECDSVVKTASQYFRDHL